MRASTTALIVDELRSFLGERLSTGDAVREHHSHGESWHEPGLPDAVAFPETTDEVATIVRLCAQARVPVIAFGMGSSLEGHVNAVQGGVTIDFARMTRVGCRSTTDVTVEAGLTRP
jgi:D-lactate dehydrogenase (cytochrome)